MSPTTSGGLSVKAVADLAGVSARTVRFYHSIGLVPEPPRDSSGYRRYGGREVVALVRATRLRALGMSLPQIAERMTGDEGEVSLADALGTLADDLDAEIAKLVATRDRLRDLAASETFAHPVKALTTALQQQGVLDPDDDLREGEKWAASVLDALHPDGMAGLLAQAGALLGDGGAADAFRTLRRRLRRLNEKTSDADIDAFAADVAALLPAFVGTRQLDLRLLDDVLAERMTPARHRFLSRLRTHLEEVR